jgi:hypothetical protein
MALLNQRIEGGVATLNTRGMDQFGTINDREEMMRSQFTPKGGNYLDQGNPNALTITKTLDSVMAIFKT